MLQNASSNQNRKERCKWSLAHRQITRALMREFYRSGTWWGDVGSLGLGPCGSCSTALCPNPPADVWKGGGPTWSWLHTAEPSRTQISSCEAIHPLLPSLSTDLEMRMTVFLVLIIWGTGTGRKVGSQLWKEFPIIVWWKDPKPHVFT